MSREKQSKVIAKIWSEKQHPMLGRKQSTQSKQKGSESQKRRFAHNPKLILKRDRHPNWKGGKTHNTYGYVVVLVDGSYMLEHRAIAEKMLGRKLSTKEHVHHKNGNKADNLEENLEVLSGSEHIRKHLLERWKAAREQGANCL